MEWKLSQGLVPYEDALAVMEERVAGIRAGEAEGLVWLLEHPPLYTSGSSAREADLLAPSRFPVYDAGRGGEYTYHGPGQRVAYVMTDLKALFAPEPPDLRAYIKRLEQWIIATLAELGVEGFTREGRIGVWVEKMSDDRCQMTRGASHLTSDIRHLTSDSHEAKIAAIGVRVRQWVSFHGIAINVDPELEHFSGIVPCGIREYGVTSLAQLGAKAGMREVDAALRATFEQAMHVVPA